MIKRLIIIALFTGSAYLFTVLCLKYLSLHASPAIVKSVGEIDSLANFIVSLIAAGLLTRAVRDIAISEDWKHDFLHAQRARFTFSLFLMLLALVSFNNPVYIIFLFAPVFALNGDYALYGRSYPVIAAVLAFMRVSLPFGALILACMLHSGSPVTIFIIATVLVYLLSGYFISLILKTPFLTVPSFKSLHEYVKSLRLGIVAVSYYFIGLGLIPIVSFFYADHFVALAFLGIKLYTIFKGVLRIINQSFVKEMMDEAVCLKVDRLATVAGLLFLSVVSLFPGGFNMLFFGQVTVNDKISLLILGITGLVSSTFTSLTTRAILEKKDKPYSIFAFTGMLLATVVIVAGSFFRQSVVNVYIGLFVGELICALGLVYIIGNAKMVSDRIRSLFGFLPFLSIPLLCRLVFGDNYYAMISGVAGSGAAFLITQYKTFNLPIRNAE